MASTFAGVSSIGSLASFSNSMMDKNLSISTNKLSSFASISSSSLIRRRNLSLQKSRQTSHIKAAAKELYFNKDGPAIKKLQVELEDPVENIGAKLVRQAAAKTNDLAGDRTTTSVVLAQGLITDGVKDIDSLLQDSGKKVESKSTADGDDDDDVMDMDKDYILPKSSKGTKRKKQWRSTWS